MAIARIADDEDCIVRLAAARKYGAARLLPKALEDALERDASLTVEEYERLGLELAARVVRYREAVYPRSGEVVPYVPSRFMICMRAVCGWLIELIALRVLFCSADKRELLIEEIFGDEFARDWKEGIDMGSGAA